MSIHIIVSVPRSCTYLNGHEAGLGIIAVGVFPLGLDALLYTLRGLDFGQYSSEEQLSI